MKRKPLTTAQGLKERSLRAESPPWLQSPAEENASEIWSAYENTYLNQMWGSYTYPNIALFANLKMICGLVGVSKKRNGLKGLLTIRRGEKIVVKKMIANLMHPKEVEKQTLERSQKTYSGFKQNCVSINRVSDRIGHDWHAWPAWLACRGNMTWMDPSISHPSQRCKILNKEWVKKGGNSMALKCGGVSNLRSVGYFYNMEASLLRRIKVEDSPSVGGNCLKNPWCRVYWAKTQTTAWWQHSPTSLPQTWLGAGEAATRPLRIPVGGGSRAEHCPHTPPPGYLRLIKPNKSRKSLKSKSNKLGQKSNLPTKQSASKRARQPANQSTNILKRTSKRGLRIVSECALVLVAKIGVRLRLRNTSRK